MKTLVNKINENIINESSDVNYENIVKQVIDIADDKAKAGELIYSFTTAIYESINYLMNEGDTKLYKHADLLSLLTRIEDTQNAIEKVFSIKPNQDKYKSYDEI